MAKRSNTEHFDSQTPSILTVKHREFDSQTPRIDSQTPRYLPFVRSYPQKQARFIPNLNSDILKC